MQRSLLSTLVSTRLLTLPRRAKVLFWPSLSELPKLLSLQPVHAIVMDLYSITLSSLQQTKCSNAKLHQGYKYSQNPDN